MLGGLDRFGSLAQGLQLLAQGPDPGLVVLHLRGTTWGPSRRDVRAAQRAERGAQLQGRPTLGTLS